MDSMQAFMMGSAHRDKEQKVFDWRKAARLIKELKPRRASAGLKMDWEWTGGEIFSDGKPDLESYTYLSSCWATPEIDLDGDVQDCYIMQSDAPEWGPDTKWPAEALAILEGKY